MKVSSDDCGLEDSVLNAVLLQVVPGRETATLKEIDDRLGADVAVYMGFGRYDFLLLSEREDFSLLKSFNEKGLTYTTEWFPLLGLKWRLHGRKRTSLTGDSKLLGLVSIKLDLNYCEENEINPIECEMEIIKQIKEALPCTAYSSFGFNEIIILLETSSFRQLANKLISIKKILTKDGIPIAFDVSTIPAINYRLWIQDHELVNTNERICVHLLLSLRIGMSKSFNQKLDSILGKEDNRTSIYGFHDTLLEVSGDVTQVVEKISKIREEGGKFGLCSTFSMLPHYDELLVLNNLSPRVTGISKVDSPYFSTEEPISQLDQRACQFNFYKRLYGALQQDQSTRHLFRDFGFFDNVDKLFKEAEKVRSEKIWKYPRINETLDNLEECLRLGFQQRCSGVIMGNLLAHRTFTIEPMGNLNRAIMAMESIPRYLLRKLGVKWAGFCIYGFSSRFYLTRSEVINIPDRFRLVPEVWTGVFHETGHDVVNHLNAERKTKVMAEVHRIRRHFVKTDWKHRTEAELTDLKWDILEFAHEIFAELFSYHFCFNDDWRLYVQRYWSYFPKEFKIDYQHVSRSVIAYFTLGPGKGLERDEVTIERIDECIAQIEAVTKKSAGKLIDHDEWTAAVDQVWRFLDMGDLMRTIILSAPIFCRKDQVKEIQNALRKGRVVKHNNPIEIYQSLLSDYSHHKCKQRFATLLSLCYAGMSLPERRRNN